MLSLPGSPAVGESWYCDKTKTSCFGCLSKGTTHQLSLTYPSGSFLAPCVSHHSSISVCAVSCAASTWLWIALGVAIVVLTSSLSGMSITTSLLCLPLSTLGGHIGILGAAWILLGMCLKMRLKSCKLENHHATCWLTFCGDFQWSRLVCMVRIVTGSSIAAKWGLDFMSGMYTPRNSHL